MFNAQQTKEKLIQPRCFADSVGSGSTERFNNRDLVLKTPADGLCGKSDEDNLGFTYAALDHYIRTGECDDPRVKAIIDDKHAKNLFKLKPIPHFEYKTDK